MAPQRSQLRPAVAEAAPQQPNDVGGSFHKAPSPGPTTHIATTPHIQVPAHQAGLTAAAAVALQQRLARQGQGLLIPTPCKRPAAAAAAAAAQQQQQRHLALLRWCGLACQHPARETAVSHAPLKPWSMAQRSPPRQTSPAVRRRSRGRLPARLRAPPAPAAPAQTPTPTLSVTAPGLRCAAPTSTCTCAARSAAGGDPVPAGSGVSERAGALSEQLVRSLEEGQDTLLGSRLEGSQHSPAARGPSLTRLQQQYLRRATAIASTKAHLDEVICQAVGNVAAWRQQQQQASPPSFAAPGSEKGSVRWLGVDVSGGGGSPRGHLCRAADLPPVCGAVGAAGSSGGGEGAEGDGRHTPSVITSQPLSPRAAVATAAVAVAPALKLLPTSPDRLRSAGSHAALTSPWQQQHLNTVHANNTNQRKRCSTPQAPQQQQQQQYNTNTAPSHATNSLSGAPDLGRVLRREASVLSVGCEAIEANRGMQRRRRSVSIFGGASSGSSRSPTRQRGARTPDRASSPLLRYLVTGGRGGQPPPSLHPLSEPNHSYPGRRAAQHSNTTPSSSNATSPVADPRVCLRADGHTSPRGDAIARPRSPDRLRIQPSVAYGGTRDIRALLSTPPRGRPSSVQGGGGPVVARRGWSPASRSPSPLRNPSHASPQRCHPTGTEGGSVPVPVDDDPADDDGLGSSRPYSSPLRSSGTLYDFAHLLPLHVYTHSHRDSMASPCRAAPAGQPRSRSHTTAAAAAATGPAAAAAAAAAGAAGPAATEEASRRRSHTAAAATATARVEGSGRRLSSSARLTPQLLRHPDLHPQRGTPDTSQHHPVTAPVEPSSPRSTQGTGRLHLNSGAGLQPSTALALGDGRGHADAAAAAALQGVSKLSWEGLHRHAVSSILHRLTTPRSESRSGSKSGSKVSSWSGSRSVSDGPAVVPEGDSAATPTPSPLARCLCHRRQQEAQEQQQEQQEMLLQQQRQEPEQQRREHQLQQGQRLLEQKKQQERQQHEGAPADTHSLLTHNSQSHSQSGQRAPATDSAREGRAGPPPRPASPSSVRSDSLPASRLSPTPNTPSAASTTSTTEGCLRSPQPGTLSRSHSPPPSHSPHPTSPTGRPPVSPLAPPHPSSTSPVQSPRCDTTLNVRPAWCVPPSSRTPPPTSAAKVSPLNPPLTPLPSSRTGPAFQFHTHGEQHPHPLPRSWGTDVADDDGSGSVATARRVWRAQHGSQDPRLNNPVPHTSPESNLGTRPACASSPAEAPELEDTGIGALQRLRDELGLPAPALPALRASALPIPHTPHPGAPSGTTPLPPPVPPHHRPPSLREHPGASWHPQASDFWPSHPHDSPHPTHGASQQHNSHHATSFAVPPHQHAPARHRPASPRHASHLVLRSCSSSSSSSSSCSPARAYTARPPENLSPPPDLHPSPNRIAAQSALTGAQIEQQRFYLQYQDLKRELGLYEALPGGTLVAAAHGVRISESAYRNLRESLDVDAGPSPSTPFNPMQTRLNPWSKSSAGSLQQPRISQNRVIRGARLISPVGSFLGGLFKQKAAPAVDPRGAEIVEELIELTKKGSKQTAERDEEVEELVQQLSRYCMKNPLKSPLLWGEYEVLYCSKPAAVGGPLTKGVGPAVFQGQSARQILTAPDQLLNLVQFKTLGFLPGTSRQYGEIQPVSGDTFVLNITRGEISTGFGGPIVKEFDIQRQIKIEYLDERLRIARFQPSDSLDDEQANSSEGGKIQDEILFIFGRIQEDEDEDEDDDDAPTPRLVLKSGTKVLSTKAPAAAGSSKVLSSGTRVLAKGTARISRMQQQQQQADPEEPEEADPIAQAQAERLSQREAAIAIKKLIGELQEEVRERQSATRRAAKEAKDAERPSQAALKESAAAREELEEIQEEVQELEEAAKELASTAREEAQKIQAAMSAVAQAQASVRAAKASQAPKSR
ncbi:MAG: hypothetical protein WDW36_009665 [Sanguina aurantia]